MCTAFSRKEFTLKMWAHFVLSFKISIIFNLLCLDLGTKYLQSVFLIFSPLFFQYSRTLQLCIAHSKKKTCPHRRTAQNSRPACDIYSFVRFSIYINTPLIHSGKSGLSNLGKAIVATRAALPIPISVCSITMCPNNGMAGSVGDF